MPKENIIGKLEKNNIHSRGKEKDIIGDVVIA
jgi:hypothetical protein